jgi:pimeloyl-ACP methyl ester carboxylesterase
MGTISPIQPWQSQLGSQRDWVWRGWQIRYTYIRANQPDSSSVPVLFLHGFASALTQWRSNLAPLSQSHTVYALDLVGFGASEKAATAYNVSLWVEQVYDFWRSLIGQPVVLVGHSLGALVALTAAATHPDMVQGLSLITLPAARQELLSGKMQAIAGSVESWFAHPLLIRPLFSLLKRPSILRSILRAAYGNAEHVTEELVSSFALPASDRGAAGVFCRLSQARTQADFSQATKTLLPQIQVPILMIWGEKDRVIPLTWGRQLVALHADLKMVEIAHAGHCPYDEAADQVNAALLDWIADRCLSASDR